MEKQYDVNDLEDLFANYLIGFISNMMNENINL